MAAWFKRSTATSLPSRVFDCQSGVWRQQHSFDVAKYDSFSTASMTPVLYDLGQYKFCALTGIRESESNGLCEVRKTATGWAIRARGSTYHSGREISCLATCFK